MKLYDPVSKETMLILGFEEITPSIAKSWGCATASINGDNVWFMALDDKNERDLWVQGFPTGEQLFNMIFNAGQRMGDQIRLNVIKEALGLN